MQKRFFLAAIAAATLGLLAGPAAAQQWKPNKPINLVVPWAAGGSTDQVTRVTAAELEKVLGQKIVVVNQPGASGSIGTKTAWEAPKDGYTWAAGAAQDLGAYQTLGMLDVPASQWHLFLTVANVPVVGVNAGKLWDDGAYLDNGGVNHVVTVTGVACDAATGAINGFYIADSGRGMVSDMTRYLSLADFRADANVPNAYAIYTVEPIKLWEENIDGTGNALDNLISGNRGDNVLTGGKGRDTLMGGAGGDTYMFSRGDGTDTIVESDGFAGNVDSLRFTDLNQDQLCFSQVGNNLQIDVIAPAATAWYSRSGARQQTSSVSAIDQITVKDWYLPDAQGGDRQLERIATADGLSLSNTDVDRLIQAMASFAVPAMAQTVWVASPLAAASPQMAVVH